MATQPNTLFEMFTATPQLTDAQRQIAIADYEAEQARDEACRYIKDHRRKRDRAMPGDRAWHVEQIKVDWWLNELLRATGRGEA